MKKDNIYGKLDMIKNNTIYEVVYFCTFILINIFLGIFIIPITF